MPNTRPYGSWLSPVTSELIVAESIGLSGLQIDERTSIGWKAVRASKAVTCWCGIARVAGRRM